MGPSVFGYLAHDVLLLGYGRLSPPWVVNILEGRVRSHILTPGVSSACVPPDIAGTSARHRLAGLASGCPDIPSGGIHRDTIRHAGPGYACVICGPCLSPLSSESWRHHCRLGSLSRKEIELVFLPHWVFHLNSDLALRDQVIIIPVFFF